MGHEVIVVGGGIGGLTVAALLAARGFDVCLFERQSQVGGCVVKFEHLGQSFDPTFGLYSGWETGGVWERVFAELHVAPPPVTKLSPNFAVRLPNGTEVPVSSDPAALEQNVVSAFPECADTAVHFMREALKGHADLESLKKSSENFRAFIDAQLAFLAQRTLDTAEPSRVADTLKLAIGDLWEFDGGAQSLADRLAASLKENGAKLRLNSPVLRLAYADDGTPNGVDLLSGERVTATRAIVSNLTVWDTYGKLVGLRRTPPAASAQLKQMSAWGVYQVFMLIDEAAVARLPARRMIFASSAEEPSPAPHMFLNIQSPSDQTRSAGKHSATLSEFIDVDDWFAFHEDSSWHEERDQAMLEKIWSRFHAAAPDVSDAAEVFETATPQTFYESVRRKMGMVGSPMPLVQDASTHIETLLMVGDTVSQRLGLAGVAAHALLVASLITR
jgi:phytoene dehydrogenase-like protein